MYIFYNSISTLQSIAAIVSAVATVILAFVTFYYAMQTRNTVKELNRQSKENERKGKIEEAQEINKCICIEGIKITSKLLADEEISEKDEEKLIALIFNKHNYIIEPAQVEKLHELHELIYRKFKNGSFKSDEKIKYNQHLTDLYQFFWNGFEEMNSICLENSSVSKEIINLQKNILKNGKT